MHSIPIVILPSTTKWIIRKTILMKFVEILVFFYFNPSSYLLWLKMLSKPNLIDVQLVIYKNLVVTVGQDFQISNKLDKMC